MFETTIKLGKNHQRAAQNVALDCLKYSPIAYINGPRQAGKSTLVKQIAKQQKIPYATFDDISLLSAANHNPKGFVKNLSKPVALDEIQMAKKIFPALKKEIDQLRHQKNSKINGSFLFSGSANIMALPELAESFVGRMQTVTLYPFSTREIYKKSGNFIEILFKKKFQLGTKISDKISPITAMKKASFPEISLAKKIDSNRWFNDYIQNLMQRDIKNLSMIDKISIMPQMLKILASRAGSLLNNSDMARCCNMNQMSFLRYRALLEAVFLIFPSVPWFRNIGKRFVKTPKIFFNDTCLLAYFLGVELDDLDKKNPTLFGQILENFVATELVKQLSLLASHSLYHYRTHDGKEIDFVIERGDGKLVAIEVKSSASLDGRAFKAMEDLQKSIKKDFVCGVILYCGSEIIPFGDRLFALPIQSLWEI